MAGTERHSTAPRLSARSDARAAFALGAEGSAPYALVTYALVHNDAAHLIANTVGMTALEASVGAAGALALFVLATAGGGLAFIAGPDGLSLVGASGGGIGLLVATAILAASSAYVWTKRFVWVLLALARSFVPASGVSVSCHLRGAVMGFVFAVAVRVERTRDHALRVAPFVVAGSAIALAWGIVEAVRAWAPTG